jgi:broad specificity phosphatase PhoE
LIIDGAFFKDLDHPVDFILIRHGESEGNSGGIFQGHSEYPLTDEGRAQARQRGRSLVSGPTKTAILSSPLSRALESARIIGQELDLEEVQVVPELIEFDLGDWTGRTWTELKAASPQLWNRFRTQSWAGVESTERPEALYDRACSAWRILRDRAQEDRLDRVIALTHGGLLQWLLRSTFGCRSWLPLFPIHNCGLFRLRVEPASPEGAFMAWEAMDEHL